MHDVERSEAVLILIDLINPFDYVGGQELLAQARRILPQVAALRARFTARRLATVFVNDNFGRWRSSFSETFEHCLARSGGDVVGELRPEPSDYFVLKPHRSGFYATPLEHLLQALRARTLVFAGISTEMCVLATVSDAQIRGYETIVATDCTAALNEDRHERALSVMEKGFATRLAPGCQLP